MKTQNDFNEKIIELFTIITNRLDDIQLQINNIDREPEKEDN